MATLAELKQRVFDHLYGMPLAERPALDQLDGAINDSTTALVVQEVAIRAGSILEFEDNDEQVLIVEEFPDVGDRTVIRARNGTTAGSHADLALFAIDPVYTRKMVADAINACLVQMHDERLYLHKTGTFVLVAGQDFYELSETDVFDDIGVVSVFYQADSPGDEIVALPFQPIEDMGGIVGPGFHLLSWGDKASGDTLTYIYAAEIDTAADTDVDPALEEIVVMGAVYRMLALRTGARTHNPGRQTDRTVQPGQTWRDASWFLGAYKRLVNQHRANIHLEARRFPRHPRFSRALRWRW